MRLFQYGISISTRQALLKKHQALMADIEAFGSTVKTLRVQADACRVSVAILLFTFIVAWCLPAYFLGFSIRVTILLALSLFTATNE